MDLVIVEVAIGLSFLFFLLSIVASAVAEVIAGVTKLRARMLEKGIVNMITGSTKPDPARREFVNQLYSHSLVAGLSNDVSTQMPRNKPSYLSSRSFRNALLDITDLLETTSTPSDDPRAVAEIRAAVEEKLHTLGELNQNLEQSLTAIWRSVDHNATEFRAGVERWFDRGMERVSGWYPRRSKLILFIVGVVVAVGINASAVTAADQLWKNDGVRDGLIAQLENQPEETTGTEALEDLDDLAFPIGWEESNRPDSAWEWMFAAGGWLLTGIAVTFGAAFWFDLLGKVSNLRSAGKKPSSVLTPAPTKSEVNEVRLTVGSDES